MIIIKLTSGLGNQMFQFALYKYFENQGVEVKVDHYNAINQNFGAGYGFEIENVFNLNVNKAIKEDIDKLKSSDSLLVKLFRRFNIVIGKSKNHYLEPHFEFDPSVKSINNSKYLDGYWQSIKYFENIQDIIKNSFSFNINSSSQNLKTKEQMGKVNSVSVHVRRGDYVNNKLHGGICNESYYKKAINCITDRVEKPIFYVFSDDIMWCRNHLNIENAIYVDWNINNESYRDMELMTKCKHNIIANSSFSWWGAYLNKNKNQIVICPDKWFNDTQINTSDLYLSQWIKI